MTTRVIISIPYVCNGTETVIETLQNGVVTERVIAAPAVEEITIWSGLEIHIYERPLGG